MIYNDFIINNKYNSNLKISSEGCNFTSTSNILNMGLNSLLRGFNVGNLWFKFKSVNPLWVQTLCSCK